MTPLELYNFIKLNISNEQICIETIEAEYLANEIKGITRLNTETAGRYKERFNTNTTNATGTVYNSQSNGIDKRLDKG